MKRAHEAQLHDPKNPTFSDFRRWLKRNFGSEDKWPDFLEIFDTYREQAPVEIRKGTGTNSGVSLMWSDDAIFYNTWYRGKTDRYKAGFEMSDSGYYGFFEEIQER